MPERCAFNVALMKAYDTLEWDFLLQTLGYMNFPSRFIGWIRECISTPHFSINVNGRVAGYFSGARGIRQGDPISPYLFVIAMEVLHADAESILVLKNGTDMFTELHANPQKSNAFFSAKASARTLELRAIVNFPLGSLPIRYLGIPLKDSRLTKTDCLPLITKVKIKVGSWACKSLSYVGRVQLIKSELGTMHVYWSGAFMLPKGVFKEIESILRNFLWHGSTEYTKAKVAWNVVCKPIREGGQGI